MTKAKVKQLEWKKTGEYLVGKAGEFEFAIKYGWSQQTPYEFRSDSFATEDEAKSAAQALFEKNIRSALA